MRMTTLVLLGVACGMPEEIETEPSDLKAGEASMRVALSAEAPMHWAKNATIVETDQLFFVADVSLPAGAHTAAFEIDDPNGNLYQRDDVPFDGSEGRIVDSMPVLGTWISQYDMRGRWTCRLYVDGSGVESTDAAFYLH